MTVTPTQYHSHINKEQPSHAIPTNKQQPNNPTPYPNHSIYHSTKQNNQTKSTTTTTQKQIIERLIQTTESNKFGQQPPDPGADPADLPTPPRDGLNGRGRSILSPRQISLSAATPPAPEKEVGAAARRPPWEGGGCESGGDKCGRGACGGGGSAFFGARDFIFQIRDGDVYRRAFNVTLPNRVDVGCWDVLEPTSRVFPRPFVLGNVLFRTFEIDPSRRAPLALISDIGSSSSSIIGNFSEATPRFSASNSTHKLIL